MTRIITCVYLKKNAEGLKAMPFPGEFGKRLFNEVSAEAWAIWLEHQKMLVNEYRLNLADAHARSYLREQTEKFFFGEGVAQASGYVPISDDADKTQ